MSAFLVNEDVLYKSMRAIKVASTNSWTHDLKDELESNPGNVFYKLNYLNRHALNQRYGDDIGKSSYKFSSTKWINANLNYNNIECYKALQCFMYQCSEGSTIKKELFKLIEKLEGCLADIIISKTAEYKAASWS